MADQNNKLAAQLDLLISVYEQSAITTATFREKVLGLAAPAVPDVAGLTRYESVLWEAVARLERIDHATPEERFAAANGLREVLATRASADVGRLTDERIDELFAPVAFPPAPITLRKIARAIEREVLATKASTDLSGLTRYEPADFAGIATMKPVNRNAPREYGYYTATDIQALLATPKGAEPKLCDYGTEDDFDEAHDEWERAKRYAEVGEMEYNGNTVSYMYSKAKNYGGVLVECCGLLGGKGHIRDRIMALIAERDALRGAGYPTEAAPVAPEQAVPEGVPDWQVEALRQFKHNDGSGFVFGYDKEVIDRVFSCAVPPVSAFEQPTTSVPRAASIDSEEFHELAMNYRGAGVRDAQKSYAALIAHIDAHVAAQVEQSEDTRCRAEGGITSDEINELHNCAAEAAAEWACKEYEHAKNMGAGGPGNEDAANKAEGKFRDALARLAHVARQPAAAVKLPVARQAQAAPVAGSGDRLIAKAARELSYEYFNGGIKIARSMNDFWTRIKNTPPDDYTSPVATQAAPALGSTPQADSGPVVQALEQMIAETDLTYKRGILRETIRRIRAIAPVAQEGEQMGAQAASGECAECEGLGCYGDPSDSANSLACAYCDGTGKDSK